MTTICTIGNMVKPTSNSFINIKWVRAHAHKHPGISRKQNIPSLLRYLYSWKLASLICCAVYCPYVPYCIILLQHLPTFTSGVVGNRWSIWVAITDYCITNWNLYFTKVPGKNRIPFFSDWFSKMAYFPRSTVALYIHIRGWSSITLKP